ncbi:MAG: hypothetical protein IPG04_19770 [Polyangiaceae bacterium]|nr:hypothetical protein [Polyangiaceae bacterium]
MIRRYTRVLWVVAAVAAGGFAAYDVRYKPGPKLNDRYSRDLRELQALDARLDGEVMRSRQGLVAHYDEIVRARAAEDAVMKRLALAPEFARPNEKQELADLVSRLSVALEEKSALVEEFKTENAVLRNSVRFFPVAAKELRDSLLADPDPDAKRLAAEVNDVLVSVLEVHDVPGSGEGRAQAEAAIEALSNEADPVGRDRDVDIVLRHAKAIVERGGRVDAITNALLAVPTARATVEVDVAYERAFRRSLSDSARRRIILLVLGFAALVAFGVDTILRLSKSAAQERAANERLAEANRALVREKERERELLDLKSKFVSMTSHEFRTPLSVILSSTELLEAYGDRWSPAKRADHFARIKNASAGMEDMLDSILVIGRSEMGRLECNPAALDLTRWTHHLVETFRPTLGAKHRLVETIDPELEEGFADEKLLNHILTNLLSNAVKYSPEGGDVRFDARREGDSAVFVVADKGIGIPKQDLARLFDSFHRCSNVGHIRGTGLGLAVVKRAVDAHGGTLELESAEGEGTTFTVKVPIHERVVPAAKPSEPQRDATAAARSS